MNKSQLHMMEDADFLRNLAAEIDASELTQLWRRDRDWLREIAATLEALASRVPVEGER